MCACLWVIDADDGLTDFGLIWGLMGDYWRWGEMDDWVTSAEIDFGRGWQRRGAGRRRDGDDRVPVLSLPP